MAKWDCRSPRLRRGGWGAVVRVLQNKKEVWCPSSSSKRLALLDCFSPRLASFLFLYFSKTFFTEIYFQFHNLQFYTPTARQGGGRGPAARQEGGRDLFVNKKIYLRGRSLDKLLWPLDVF